MFWMPWIGNQLLSDLNRSIMQKALAGNAMTSV